MQRPSNFIMINNVDFTRWYLGTISTTKCYPVIEPFIAPWFIVYFSVIDGWSSLYCCLRFYRRGHCQCQHVVRVYCFVACSTPNRRHVQLFSRGHCRLESFMITHSCQLGDCFYWKFQTVFTTRLGWMAAVILPTSPKTLKRSNQQLIYSTNIATPWSSIHRGK